MSAIPTLLVGYGYAGRTFHAPLIAACPGLRLQAVVSSDAAKVQADRPDLRVHGSLAAALDAEPEVQLVVLATPNQLHAQQATLALQAGRHVVVDKPFTVTVTEGHALVALARRRQRLLSVFHNRRWDGDFLTLRQLIADGELGRVTACESRFDRFRPERRERWREQAVAGGGLWYDLGPHLVDQALQLFGVPRRVWGCLDGLRDGALVDDWAQVLLDYGHCKLTLSASMLVGGGLPRFAVHGTRGSWIKHGLDQQEAQLLAGKGPDSAGWGVDPAAGTLYGGEAARPVPNLPGRYQDFYAGCAAAISQGAPHPVPASEALAVMEVIEAARRSAREGGWVVPGSPDPDAALSGLPGA